MKNQSFFKIFVLLAVLSTGAAFMQAVPGEAQNVELPDIVSTSSPSIPPVAVAARVSGHVAVELTLDAQGRVLSAHADVGHPLLRKSTEQSVLQWRFAPANYAKRTLRLTFVYPRIAQGEAVKVTVLPYQKELKLAFEKGP